MLFISFNIYLNVCLRPCNYVICHRLWQQITVLK